MYQEDPLRVQSIATYLKYQNVLTITFNPLSEKSFLCQRQKWLPMKNYCSSIRPTQLLPHITWHKVIIHKHSECRRCKGCKKSLDNYPKQTVATKVITTFLDLILSLNSFIFNSVNYLQTKGCAMRTIWASSYSQH